MAFTVPDGPVVGWIVLMTIAVPDISKEFVEASLCRVGGPRHRIFGRLFQDPLETVLAYEHVAIIGRLQHRGQGVVVC